MHALLANVVTFSWDDFIPLSEYKYKSFPPRKRKNVMPGGAHTYAPYTPCVYKKFYKSGIVC